MEQYAADSPTNQPASPAQPTSQMPIVSSPSNQSKNKALVFILVGLIVLLGGVTAGAYYFKIWPFSVGSLEKKAAFENLFTKVNEIASAGYEFNLEFKGVPRESGVKTLNLEFPEIKEQREMYKRDNNRLADTMQILRSLNNRFRGSNAYPSSLSDLPDMAGVAINQYIYSSSGSDFSLIITFETEEVITYIKESGERYPVIISDKSVTFTKATKTPFYYFSTELAEPQWVAVVENQDELYQEMPSDTQAKLTFSGTAAQNQDKKADAQFHAAMELTLGDLSLAVDGDLLKKGEVFYGRINRMPSLFIDIAAIKQKWIKITRADMDDFGYFNVESVGDPEKDVSVTLLEQLKLALVTAYQEHVLVVDYSLADEMTDDKNFYVYQVSVDSTKVAGWYERLEKELREKYGDKALLKLDKTTLKILQGPSFKEYMDYINANNRWKIVVDPRTGFPVRFDSWSRLVPPDGATKLADRQFELSSSLKLSNINQPVTVQEPTESMSVEDVMILFMGVTKEEYRFQKQMQNISSLRYALETYKRRAGVYPANLEQLLVKLSEVPKADQKNTSSGVVIDFPDEYSYDYPLIKNIPRDIFADAPFQYQTDGSGYTLKYQMIWPPKKNDNNSQYSYGIGAGVLEYINGQNTANEKVLSVEVVAAMNVDSDADKLPDFVEQYYGSDPKKADTDGDGYRDGEEVSNGYNPAGEGNLDYSDRWYRAQPVTLDLEASRQKAKVAAAKGALSAAVPATLLCKDAGGSIVYDGKNACNGSTIPVMNTAICSSDKQFGNWPDMSYNGFKYVSCSASNFSASNGNCTITCSVDDGCVSTGSC